MAIIIVGFVITTSLAYALANAVDTDLKRYFVFLSPVDMIQNLGFRLFNQRLENQDFGIGFALWNIWRECSPRSRFRAASCIGGMCPMSKKRTPKPEKRTAAVSPRENFRH